jgi:hypothetical protein
MSTTTSTPEFARDENGDRLCPSCGRPFRGWYGAYAHINAEESGIDCRLEGEVIQGGIADFASGELS